MRLPLRFNPRFFFGMRSSFGFGTPLCFLLQLGLRLGRLAFACLSFFARPGFHPALHARFQFGGDARFVQRLGQRVHFFLRLIFGVFHLA